MNSVPDNNSDLEGYKPHNPPKILTGQALAEKKEKAREDADIDDQSSDGAQSLNLLQSQNDARVQATVEKVPFVLAAINSQKTTRPPTLVNRIINYLPFKHDESDANGAALPSGPSSNGNRRAALRSIPVDASAAARASHAVQFLEGKGWTHAQAIGITANLLRESKLDPNATGDSYQATGIGQWHPDRQKEFKTRFGKDIKGSSLDDQLAFVDYELREGNERQAGLALAQAKTPEEAAATVSRKYERPRDKVQEAEVRSNIATKLAATSMPPVA